MGTPRVFRKNLIKKPATLDFKREKCYDIYERI